MTRAARCGTWRARPGAALPPAIGAAAAAGHAAGSAPAAQWHRRGLPDPGSALSATDIHTGEKSHRIVPQGTLHVPVAQPAGRLAPPLLDRHVEMDTDYVQEQMRTARRSICQTRSMMSPPGRYPWPSTCPAWQPAMRSTRTSRGRDPPNHPRTNFRRPRSPIWSASPRRSQSTVSVVAARDPRACDI